MPSGGVVAETLSVSIEVLVSLPVGREAEVLSSPGARSKADELDAAGALTDAGLDS